MFAEEEEEEEEEEEAPKAKAKAPAPAAKKAKGTPKQFQGSDTSGVAAGPSVATLAAKAIGAAAFLGGSAFGVSCLCCVCALPLLCCRCWLPPAAFWGDEDEARQNVGSAGHVMAG